MDEITKKQSQEKTIVQRDRIVREYVTIGKNIFFTFLLTLGLFLAIISIADFNQLQLGFLNPIISVTWKLCLVIAVGYFLFSAFEFVLWTIISFIRAKINRLFDRE